MLLVRDYFSPGSATTHVTLVVPSELPPVRSARSVRPGRDNGLKAPVAELENADLKSGIA
jgi:hypothetical protein